jgi:hypothetical protein
MMEPSASHMVGRPVRPVHVVKAGRKQVFTSGELHARRDDTSKLAATANTILVPSGVAIELDAPTAKVGNPS